MADPADDADAAAGGKALPDGHTGVVIAGWHVESRKSPILNTSSRQLWEEMLGTMHLPEMLFGDSTLLLEHLETGTKLHFNALDALKGWKDERLPPIEVPAAAKWKFRSKPSEQVILDYDYTFTSPYCGSDSIVQTDASVNKEDGHHNLLWEDTRDQIDRTALSSKEPILFYDEVILYEDELADNGISLLTVKVRVMPSYWFVLLRFWLRVDGVLMRLRDTRIYCAFGNNNIDEPVVLRESCWREATIASLSVKGQLLDPAAYRDPDLMMQRLPVIRQTTQRLKITGKR